MVHFVAYFNKKKMTWKHTLIEMYECQNYSILNLLSNEKQKCDQDNYKKLFVLEI